MKQQTVFDAMLELTLAELPAEHHTAWRAALLWACATHSPENLSRICSPELKQHLIDSDAGKHLIARIQDAAAKGDTSFFDELPEAFKVHLERGRILIINADVERERRHIYN